MSIAPTLLKLLALIIVAICANTYIPYLGFFPYKEILNNLDTPLFLKSFANFDGVQYLLIAKQGYMTYQQAYFPLFPILIRNVGDVFRIEYFYSGLLVSNICFTIGFYYFYKLLRIDLGNKKSLLGVLFLLLFPTSFYFHIIYTEGLFFALFISFLYFLRKEEIKKALLISLFLSITRLIGIFSVIFLLPWALKNYQNIKISKYLNLFIFTPLLGLLIYMVYLWKTTGDPLFFFHSQTAFGANRSTHIILLPQVYYRYFKMMFTAAMNWQYVVAMLEMIFFTFVTVVLCFDSYNIFRSWRSARPAKPWRSGGILEFWSFRTSLNIFSWINIVLPTLTGTFSSVPRYALFSISVFYFLANIKNKLIQYLLLAIFAVLQILLFAFFVQGYFVA